MTQKPLPLAMTLGDPSGIGPEIVLKAYAARAAWGAPPFFIHADPAHLARVAGALRIEAAVAETTPAGACAVFERALPVVALGRAVCGAPAAPQAEDAQATILSIDRAVASLARGEARAVVTAPIAKSALYAAGFAHPGHTEFLAELAARHWGGSWRAVMMLWAQLSPQETLAVVPLTIHVALKDVPRLLTRALIVETGQVVACDLSARFGVARPRLAVAGLNPHAGENGALGREEIDVIAPAVAELRAQGIDASGPFPADALFHAAARARYDAALCPTHDQALIPLKTLAFERGVNVTLGLPFARTSPDHGTAYDIAGQGVADPSSLIEAIKLAARLSA